MSSSRDSNESWSVSVAEAPSSLLLSSASGVSAVTSAEIGEKKFIEKAKLFYEPSSPLEQGLISKIHFCSVSRMRVIDLGHLSIAGTEADTHFTDLAKITTRKPESALAKRNHTNV